MGLLAQVQPFWPFFFAIFILGVCIVSRPDRQDNLLRKHQPLTFLEEHEAPEEMGMQTAVLLDIPLEYKLADDAPSSPNILEIKVTNKYIERNGEPLWQYPWLRDPENPSLLVEPHQPQTLYVRNSVPGESYKWFIIAPDGKGYQEYEGDKVIVELTEVGTYSLIVRAAAAGLEQRVTLYTRYVRREIRQLTDGDLDRMLDAMAALWRVPQAQGEALYGPHYLSAATLLQAHLELAGQQDCDHMHDGMGFLPHHMALTLLFEQSMQAVDPSTALPYWDYSIDFQRFEDLDQPSSGFELTRTELFRAKFFGATDKDTLYIKDGRWKGLEVPTAAGLAAEGADVAGLPVNAWGQLRAPWTSNRDPHLVRSFETCGKMTLESMPSANCAAFHGLLQQPTLAEYARFVSYDPHGPVHILLGGTLNCEAAYDRLGALFSEAEVADYREFAFGHHKNLFRWGILTCEAEQDSCSCPDLEAHMATEEARRDFLHKMNFNFEYDDFTPEQLRLLADVVCNSGLVEGDQLQASSSYAPEFWPIHPALERAYQWKALAHPFDDQAWLAGDGSWMDVAYAAGTCSGHLATDPVLGGLLDLSHLRMGAPAGGGGGGGGGGVAALGARVSLQEWFGVMDPHHGGLPYVYDNFLWAHCRGEHSMGPHL